jgi:sugar O-acyltransferase (sialic acid O-acetyltransferase NeuD family)
MDSIIIYGNGKIARIIYHFVKTKFDVVAFTVDREFINAGDEEFEALPLVPFESVQKTYSTKKHKMLVCVGYVAMNNVREAKYVEAKSKGYDFVNYIHPSVEIHDNIAIGENNIILDHVSLQPYVLVGNSNFIWSNAVVAHGAKIGNTNWITSGVVISGDTTIKSRCFLGVNASIGHNIQINNESFVGANTLVTKNTNEKEVLISKEGEKFRLDSQRFLHFAGV